MSVETAGNIDTTDSSAVEAPINIDAAMESALSGALGEVAADKPGEKPAPSTEAKPEEVDWTKFDLSKAPQEIREKLYRDFQPSLQKRVDDLAASQNQLLERAVAAFEQRNSAPATPDIKQKIQEAVERGDFVAVTELVTSPLRQEVDSIKNSLTRQQALDAAIRADPTIPQNENEIASRLKANPELLQMASVAGNRYAPYVLQGLSAVIRAEKVVKENEALKANFKAAVEKAVKDDRAARAALVNRLGPSSTKAGTSQAPLRENAGDLDINQALAGGWEEAVAAARS